MIRKESLSFSILGFLYGASVESLEFAEYETDVIAIVNETASEMPIAIHGHRGLRAVTAIRTPVGVSPSLPRSWPQPSQRQP